MTALPISTRPISTRPGSTMPISAGATRAHLRLRLTRRGRVVLTAIASVPVVAAIAAFALFGGSSAIATADQSSTSFTYVTVQSGQSLWSVAESVDPSGDPRDVIAEIQNLNRLQSSDVQAGQRLAIPAKYAK